jgi:hypothetical protein
MQPCTLRLPGCNNDPETTVFAHAPSIDNGMGLKAAQDFWGAFACSNCHDVADRRVSLENDRPLKIFGERSRPQHRLLWSWEMSQAWMRGIYETQKALIEQGLMSFDDR